MAPEIYHELISTDCLLLRLYAIILHLPCVPCSLRSSGMAILWTFFGPIRYCELFVVHCLH